MYALLSYITPTVLAVSGLFMGYCVKKVVGLCEDQVAMRVGGQLIQRQTAQALDHQGMKPVGFFGFIAALALLRKANTFKYGLLRMLRYGAELGIGFVSGLAKLITGPLFWPFLILTKGLFGGASRKASEVLDAQLRDALNMRPALSKQKVRTLRALRRTLREELIQYPSREMAPYQFETFQKKQDLIANIERTLADNGYDAAEAQGSRKGKKKVVIDGRPRYRQRPHHRRW